jgi:5-methylcytosine-specific restriction endonuclease McrA
MPTFKRNKNGVTTIVRDTYRKKPLLNTKAAKSDTWWSICAAVKKRDGYRCVSCRTPEGKKAGEYLHVHHIKELSAGGRTVMANLISLCPTCHQRRHRHSIHGGRKH